ncbi:NifU family protein [Streptomyces fuscichromogenes]|uniref:NifU family protein n=1 Tax=Streptomyces fuscichromogenes TaxID=1324013 RepID=UPI0038097217
MPQAREVVQEVLALLEPMVAPDGGSIRLAEFAPEQSRLTVDYSRGRNDACSTCVLDGDSLKAFIEEGLQTRGIALAEVTVREPG